MSLINICIAVPGSSSVALSDYWPKDKGASGAQFAATGSSWGGASGGSSSVSKYIRACVGSAVLISLIFSLQRLGQDWAVRMEVLAAGVRTEVRWDLGADWMLLIFALQRPGQAQGVRVEILEVCVKTKVRR